MEVERGVRSFGEARALRTSFHHGAILPEMGLETGGIIPVHPRSQT
jgi:hypothetical protein